MSDNPNSVEEKIVTTTIECIEQYGIAGATNRRIAEAAGVNLAAINYYFRSKDALMQRVMEITLKNAFDLSDLPAMPEASARERCVAVFLEILEGGVQYPNITRAHFHNLLVEGQPDPTLSGYVKSFIETLTQDLRARDPHLKGESLTLALMQIFSAVAMAVLTPSLIEGQGIKLSDAPTRKAYVGRLVDGLLGV